MTSLPKAAGVTVELVGGADAVPSFGTQSTVDLRIVELDVQLKHGRMAVGFFTTKTPEIEEMRDKAQRAHDEFAKGCAKRQTFWRIMLSMGRMVLLLVIMAYCGLFKGSLRLLTIVKPVTSIH